MRFDLSSIFACICALLMAPTFTANNAVAQSLDFELKAGSSIVTGSVNIKQSLNSGYMKYGFSGVYSDFDSTSYRWGAIQALVGNDTFWPGFWAEVGLKGLYGSAEKRIYSGDIGAIAFTGRLGYSIPRSTIPIPLDFFGGLSYAPNPLTFLDVDTYSEAMIGVGIGIIEQATLEISYHAFNLDMEKGPGSWNFDDSAFFFGVGLRF